MVWAGVYTSIGYLFGEIIKSELSYIQHIEKYIIGFLLLVGIIIFAFSRRKKKK